MTTIGGGCKFLNLHWFKNTNHSWMQTSRRCLSAFLTWNKSSVPNSWRHAPSPSVSIQLSLVITYASRHYVTTETALRVFHFFTALFSWVTNKNLQHDHCSSICNARPTSLTKKVQTFSLKSTKRRLAVTDLIWDYDLIRLLDSKYSLFLLLLIYSLFYNLFLLYCYFFLLYLFSLIYCVSST